MGHTNTRARMHTFGVPFSLLLDACLLYIAIRGRFTCGDGRYARLRLPNNLNKSTN